MFRVLQFKLFWHNLLDDKFDRSSVDEVKCAYVCSRRAFITCNESMQKQQAFNRVLFYKLHKIQVIFFFFLSFTGGCLSNVKHTAACAFKHTGRVSYAECLCWKCGIVGPCAKRIWVGLENARSTFRKCLDSWGSAFAKYACSWCLSII